MPNEDDYYGELATHPDPARAVGWESAPAQRARFEVAARHIRPGDRVLDLGAGLGDLGRFLLASGWRGDYLGLERDPRLLARGRATHPEVAVRAADFLVDACGQADVVVAIGVLVDGRSLRSDGVRFSRVRRLLGVVRAATLRTGIVVLLDQDRLEAHPILSAEPALGGVRRAELAWLAPDANVEPVLERELALVMRR